MSTAERRNSREKRFERRGDGSGDRRDPQRLRIPRDRDGSFGRAVLLAVPHCRQHPGVSVIKTFVSTSIYDVEVMTVFASVKFFQR